MFNIKRNGRWILYQLLILCFICLTVIIPGGCASKESEGENVDEKASLADETEEAITIIFPYEIDDGKLVAESLFTSTIENPDNHNEYGEEIATLQVRNQSGEFLEEASLTVAMDDGSMIEFAITNLPDGKSVWVFAKDNQPLYNPSGCLEIQGKGTYTKDETFPADEIEVSVSDHEDGTDICLKNLTDQDLKDITASYHTVFEDVYFGGISYSSEIDCIPVDGSYTFGADECLLGSAEIVKIQK